MAASHTQSAHARVPCTASSLFHTLDCGHHIKTPSNQNCGTNCSPPHKGPSYSFQTHGGFLCPTCIDAKVHTILRVNLRDADRPKPFQPLTFADYFRKAYASHWPQSEELQEVVREMYVRLNLDVDVVEDEADWDEDVDMDAGEEEYVVGAALGAALGAARDDANDEGVDELTGMMGEVDIKKHRGLETKQAYAAAAATSKALRQTKERKGVKKTRKTKKQYINGRKTTPEAASSRSHSAKGRMDAKKVSKSQRKKQNKIARTKEFDEELEGLRDEEKDWNMEEQMAEQMENMVL